MMDDWSAAFRAEMRMGFAVTNPLAHYVPPTDGLPEPLKDSAKQMTDHRLSKDEREAAAHEFLALSEEWVDRPKPDGD